MQKKKDSIEENLPEVAELKKIAKENVQNLFDLPFEIEKGLSSFVAEL